MNITIKLIPYKRIAGFFILLALVIGVYETNKPMPKNLNYASRAVRAGDADIEFLYDLTFLNKKGEKISEQAIFDKVLEMIDGAEKYILIDMFLFNSFQAKNSETFRPLSFELTQKLILKKKENPSIKIDLITDPINTVYGGIKNNNLAKLENFGVNVILTDLDKLRDSNPGYSSFWRTFFYWFKNSPGNGWLKNPFSKDDEKVTLRSYLKLLNFKANHRKVILADNGNNVTSLITSANPHDGSSRHSNVAIAINGIFWKNLYLSEGAVAKMSGKKLSNVILPEIKQVGTTSVSLLTEAAIKETLLHQINKTKKGNKISLAQFYLSDRKIIKSLIAASARGVEIKIILDPNKDAFGYKKIGVPNKQSAHELTKKSKGNIEIRWYKTHGEQFHSKLALFNKGKSFTAILGSANYTRRNLDNYNLETDVLVETKNDSKLASDFKKYFSVIWNNNGGDFTANYKDLEDRSFWKIVVYRFQEFTGLSSF